MTNEQIERSLEKKVDRLDAEFMRDGNAWTQAEYDERLKYIDDWATMEFRRAEEPAPFTSRDRRLDY